MINRFALAFLTSVSMVTVACADEVSKSSQSEPVQAVVTTAAGSGFTAPDQDWRCLLYTSPSPRDQRGSRMPSSA